MTDRKMEIRWKTTPAELRVIAEALEREGCNQVRINWYHTVLSFILDKPPQERPSTVELEGETDGSIVAEDVDSTAQCEIIQSSQYLNEKGLRDMIDYLKALSERGKEGTDDFH